MTATIVFILRILLAAVLYGFLVWAMLILWRELRANQLLAESQKFPHITIQFLDAEPPTIRQFFVPQLLVGRDPTCEICLAQEMVSAQHARISYHHNQWWVEDLQSTNGTFLNDERVYTPTVLIAGDELRCGKSNLQVILSDKNARND